VSALAMDVGFPRSGAMCQYAPTINKPIGNQSFL
jgi:hypothetical protein